MFAYNPIEADKSGRILSGFQVGAAQETARGNEALVAGVAQGATSLASGVSSAVADWAAKGDMMKENAAEYAVYDKAGLIPKDVSAMITGEKDPSKVKAYLTAVRSIAGNAMDQQRQIAVANANAAFRPSASTVGGVNMVQTSPGQWQAAPGQSSQGKAPAMFQPQVPNGVNIYGGAGNGR
jgi:hypothetical protein